MARPPAALAATIAALPDEPGVYRFRDARGTVLYIGRAVRLRRRVRSYWGDLRDRRRLLPMVARVAEIEAVICASEHEAAWLERNLLAEHKPRANRAVGGAESEVYLRLTKGGLQLVHDPPAEFGPFLGGEQTRLAVAGIHRAVPLPYAQPRTGSERAMAQARGATDGDAMLALVTAALSGEAAAVAAIAATLEQARDEQAAGLRFERAGQLQAQLSAFRWVVAEQRVTGVTPDRFDAVGWCRGVEVLFRFRDGRLREWLRHSRDELSSRPLVEATPAPWRDFARRSAELAADLIAASRAARDESPALALSATGRPGTST